MKTSTMYPCSEYQKRFFIEWALAPESTKYNVSYVQLIEGKLNKEALKRACEVLTLENPALRQRFTSDGASFEITNYTTDTFFFEDQIIGANERDIFCKIRSFLDNLFDPTKGPLNNFYLLKAAENKYYFILFSSHHIIADGEYALQVVSQLSRNYNNIVNGTAAKPSADEHYLKAIRASRETLNEKFCSAAKQFWSNLIGNTPLATQLPLSSERKPNDIHHNDAEHYFFNVDQDTNGQLRQLAKRQRTTFFITLAALFATTLSKFIQQEKFVITYPVNARPKSFKDVVGCFTNTAIFVVDVSANNSILELINALTQQRKESKKFENYPIANVVKDQRELGNIVTSDALNVSMGQTTLNNIPLQLTDLDCTPLDIPWSTEAIEDFVFYYDETDKNDLKIKISCRKNYLFEGFLEQFHQLFMEVLETTKGNGELLINDFHSISEKNKIDLLQRYNVGSPVYPEHQTFLAAFNEQCRRSYKSVAVIVEGGNYTYEQLQRLSNQLAHHLIKQTGSIDKKETYLIPVLMPRTVEMLIALIAIQKAGMAYVPISAEYPMQRIHSILDQVDAKIVVSHTNLLTNELTQSLNSQNIEVIDTKLSNEKLSEFNAEQLRACPKEAPCISIKEDQVMYVIFTSGSTGQPKGVEITHGAFIAFLYSMLQIEEIGQLSSYNTLSLTEFTFDIFGLEYGLPLLNGSYIVLSCAEEFRSHQLSNIQLIQQTPSVLAVIAQQITSKHNCVCLVGGEMLSKATASKLLGKFAHVINLYGPTETTIWSTYKVLKEPSNEIGRPLAGEIVYVLNNHLQPVEKGVIGELYIGGAGVAKGYHGSPILTDSRFIKNPHIHSENNSFPTIYRTGDLVRWLNSDELEYVCRNDFQVKINGHRIELGEIEEQLKTIPWVEDATVIEAPCALTKATEIVAFYVHDKSCFRNNDDHIVSNWNEVFSETYNGESEISGSKNSFSLWKSAIDDSQIPMDDMLRWRDTTLERIQNFRAKHVLEIGVGEGVFTELFAETELASYVGWDIEKSSVKKLASVYQYNPKFVFKQREAQEIINTDDDSFDIIFINSVVQYFPNIIHLENFIKNAVKKLKPDGILFIGDVRDYDLRHELTSKIVQTKTGSLHKKDLNKRLIEEPELLVSARFFLHLALNHFDFCVDIVKKDPSYAPELSEFRYDVVIHKRTPKNINIKTIEFENLDKIDDISLNIFIEKIPKKSLDKFLKYSQIKNKAVNVYHYSSFGKNYFSCFVSGKPDLLKNKYEISLSEIVKDINHSQLSNVPRLAKFSKERVAQNISHSLPSYMLPSKLIELDSIPLNINGKRDRQALLELTSSEYYNKNRYIEPVTPLEKMLCKIWEATLEITRVGIQDNFFDIGGNSILAIKLAINIREKTELHVESKDIHNLQTISALISQYNERLQIEEIKNQLLLSNFSDLEAQDIWLPYPTEFLFNELTQSEKLAFDNILEKMGHDANEVTEICGSADNGILIVNEHGKRAPIVWIFNNWNEFIKLAKAVNAEQPVIGMRSLHNYVSDMNARIRYQDYIAQHYCNEVTKLFSGTRQLIVGGNCQAGPIAESLAILINQESNLAPLLVSLEYFPRKRYDFPRLLMFGKESVFNPFFNSSQDPLLKWNKMFKKFDYAIIEGKHGGFFEQPTLGSLIENIEIFSANYI